MGLLEQISKLVSSESREEKERKRREDEIVTKVLLDYHAGLAKMQQEYRCAVTGTPASGPRTVRTYSHQVTGGRTNGSQCFPIGGYSSHFDWSQPDNLTHCSCGNWVLPQYFHDGKCSICWGEVKK